MRSRKSFDKIETRRGNWRKWPSSLDEFDDLAQFLSNGIHVDFSAAKEVRGDLTKLPDVKKLLEFLDSREIRQYLKSIWKEIIDDILINHSRGEKKIDIAPGIIKIVLSKFQEEIDQLKAHNSFKSLRRAKSLQDIYNTLDALFKRYHINIE